MSLLKKLAGQTALYGLSSIVGRAINFLLVPIYTALLVPEENGIITELYAYVAFLNVVYLYGMETTFFRFSNKRELSKAEVYNNVQSSVILSSILFSGILILLSGYIADALDYPGKEQYIILLALVLAIDAVVAIPFARLRSEGNAGKFAFAKLFNIFLNIFFNLFFLYFCKKVYSGEFLPEHKGWVSSIYNPTWDVDYILIANLLANGSLLLIFLPDFLRFRFQVKKDLLKQMLNYSYPLLFIGLAGMTDEMTGRILLKKLLPEGFYKGRTNLEALGIYGACYKLSMFMTLAIQAFRYASEPFFFANAANKNAPDLFAKVMKWFVIVCAFIYLFVSANLDLFGHILRGKVYREGLVVVPYLLLANLFLGVYYNLSSWYKITEKTHLGSIISFIGAGLTIVLNVALIPVLGYLGSSIATLTTYFLMTIISWQWGQKYFPVPYKWTSALFYILLATVLIVIADYNPFTGFTAHLYVMGVVFIYPLVIFLVERNEVRALRQK